tara:strand:+ start:697 stop:939 length:243 start_codon:yes stop_codon:yes gene_type:complete
MLKKVQKQVMTMVKTKMFFYLMVAVSALQFYKIYLDRSTYCAAMFVLTAAIACQFTKNKALCLVAGLIITNFVVGCSKIM